ncbi:MAG: LysM peptidoglycan-binding domain-containing protein [Elusimicrobiota bacterium]|jgi:hypothetical protein
MRGAILCAVLAAGAVGAVRPAAAQGSQVRFQSVTVRPGDTLWSIAHTYLRDPGKWDQILKYNKLPNDPTVALPGMVLRVPVSLIKEDMRAAALVYLANRVNYRRQDTAQWQAAVAEMQLYRGDSLRTFDSAKARVKFVNAQMLNLDPNSMVIIKPVAKDYDLELKSGGVFVGRSRVVTASARITPKTSDTEYSAKVQNDLSTLVEVYKGVAAVDAQGKTVDVPAGMGTEIRLGMAPAVPKLIADLPQFESRAAEFAAGNTGRGRSQVDARVAMPVSVTSEDINASQDVDAFGSDMKALSIGRPVSGYHVQAARNRDFGSLVFDKTYSVEEPIRIKEENLPPGVYWWRVATIDLLGTEQSFSAPRLYSLGVARGAKGTIDLHTSFTLLRPAADEHVSSDTYRVVGLIKQENLNVQVDGKPARIDESGNFFSTVKLKEGVNLITILISDNYGHSTKLTRRVSYAKAAQSSSGDSLLPPPDLQ